MFMNKSKVLVGIILLVYLAFIVSQFSNHHYLATVFDALILPLITITYFIGDHKKQVLFIVFLLAYSISDLMVLIVDHIPYELYYYIGNGLYILAYLTLLVKVLKSLSFLEIIKNFKLHLIVLIGLNVYIAYVLQVIVNPYVSMTNEYFVEIIYNVSMLLLLSASLLAYFYKDNKKSLFMFLGSLSIVFSEVIGVAYMYVAQQNLLNFISTTLTILAFYFFCKQTKLSNEEVNQFVG
ncbi:hypothetical protein GCM10007962_06740 [Yeosuana aromativorans]|uniref:Uncharacterized protein n=2 Tax=Yeosuana aromativorans TaxID=288019 RepID=A0A8J3BF70_9FLAO|nr:hypothetical protein GCM10007962_06740 [Yeosuana aromativorans]